MGMNGKRIERKQRILAMMLVLAMCVQFVLPVQVRAADSASSTYSTVQNDVYVDAVKTLEDAGNGIYRLTLDASSYIKSEYRTSVHEYSEDDYYVIQDDGYYLVELWGGNGAAGEDSATTDNLGGLGGNAGYVYGYMYLKKGQTLLFTIGTDGTQASVMESGGGANEGGNHETWSTYMVGGGGGYSAVFLFDQTKSAFSLTEQERLTNYIMIAGGGGGGGAASSLLETASGRPSGGRGGHIQASSSGYLSENDNNGVAGTYFAGGNGRSSGSNTKYVGIGGTDVPGAVPTSWEGWTAVLNPNDWTGTYEDGYVNENFERSQEPGCGGMGARRGGAGGAGFCGGSGGFQSTLLLSYNVGGGGGGSSFIADKTVTGQTIQWQNLSESVEDYLNARNNSRVGGSCVITYLGADPEGKTVDTTHMKDVDITASISQYFDILSVTRNGVAITDTAVSGSNITVNNVNIAPDAQGYRDNELRMEILIRAKKEFAGGNNVPVLANPFTLTPVDHTTITVAPDADTDYANVPLQGFEAVGRNYMSNEEGKAYQTTSLYKDNYDGYRTNMASWKYEFLEEISEYEVWNAGETSEITASTVEPKVTTTYVVKFEVTPKASTGVAKVGAEVVATPFKDTATITIVEADVAHEEENGMFINATKILSHDGENYLWELDVNLQSPKVFVPDSDKKVTTAGTESWEVTATGWYYIQAWGGNGGNSGRVECSGVNGGDVRNAPAGSGGTGGYVSGYVYLTKGQLVNITVGNAGSTGSSNTGNRLARANSISASRHEVHQSWAGGGGGYSSVELVGSPLIIAGGGGGAGSSTLTIAQWAVVYSQPASRNGGSVSSSISTTLASSLSSYNGSNGQRNGSGNASHFLGTPTNMTATAGTAGAAGSNYRMSGLSTGYDTTGTGQTLSETAKALAATLTTSKSSGRVGQVTITLLETEDSRSELDRIFDLSGSGTLSRYFKINSISMNAGKSYTKTTSSKNGDATTVTYANSSGTTVASFSYRVTENQDGTTSWEIFDTYYPPTPKKDPVTGGNEMYNLADLNFTFTLSPREGFLGGNDVPLVQYGSSGESDTGVQLLLPGVGGNYTGWLNKKDVSDFANVAVSYDFDETNLLTRNTTIMNGNSVDQKDLLLANSVALPTGEDAWKAEFVQSTPAPTEVVSPSVTTTYSFTQKVEPKAAAEKAVVVPSVEGISHTQTATVYVGYYVTSALAHMTYTGPDTVGPDEGLQAKLSVYSGYVMPESITVTVGGQTLAADAYSFDPATGLLTVPASQINGNVKISAEAGILTYGIFYTYEDPATGEMVTVQETGHEGKWQAGEEVKEEDLVVFNGISMPLKEGYAFHWEWGTDDGSPVKTMPASDLYVVGMYEPIVYTLTVHYVYEETDENGQPLTTKLAEDHVDYFYFGDTYNVVSPNVAGYLAEQTVVNGTMPAANVELTVKYEKTSGKLTVVYVYGDSQTTAWETCTQVIQLNDEYAVPSPVIEGYTADTLEVAGTVTAEQAESGITVYVTYNPNRYTVTFDPAGGMLAENEKTKTVAYNALYSFDPTKEVGEQYTGLPMPIRTGYEFLGWYDANGNKVEDETRVTTIGDHTLTAQWKGRTYTLTVHYNYADGRKAAEDHVSRVEYGASYNVPSPYVEGYTPAPDVIGTMGAGNKVVFVVYTIDVHSITLNCYYPTGYTENDRYFTKTIEQDYGTDYDMSEYMPAVPTGYKLPEGYDASILSGTVGIEDITIDIQYAYVDYTVKVVYACDDEAEEGDIPDAPADQILHIGESYTVNAPVVEGYTVNKNAETVTITESSATEITVTFTYTRNSYTLTVNYLYDQSVEAEALRGTVAATAHTATLKYKEGYEVEHPHVARYTTHDTIKAEGTMPAENVTVNVYYYDQEKIVSVDVEWGKLNYVYEPGDWDPQTHRYDGTFLPETDGQNKVTVTNNSQNVDIIAKYDYSTNSGYETVTGYYTDGEGQTKTQSPVLGPYDTEKNSDTAWIWLQGHLQLQNGDYTVGNCIVTIEKG